MVLAAVLLLAAACSGGGGGGDGSTDLARDQPEGEVPDLPDRHVTAMAVDAAMAHLWIGTLGGAVDVELGPGRQTRLTAGGGGLKADEIGAVAVAGDGKVWFGYSDASCPGASGYCGASRYDPAAGTWEHFDNGAGGLVDDRIFCIAEAPNGTLWLATWMGAAFGQGSSFGAWFDWHDCLSPGPHCLAIWSYHPADIAFDGEGAVWLAIDLFQIGIQPKPGGVARRDAAGRTDTWDSTDGLPVDRASRIAAGPAGVWAGSPSGLARFDPAAGAWTVERTEGVSDVAIDGAGVLWAGTDGGALRRSLDGAWTEWTGADGLPAGKVTALLAYGSKICFGTIDGVGCRDADSQEWTYPF
jgi:hypothetical protein